MPHNISQMKLIYPHNEYFRGGDKCSISLYNLTFKTKQKSVIQVKIKNKKYVGIGSGYIFHVFLLFLPWKLLFWGTNEMIKNRKLVKSLSFSRYGWVQRNIFKIQSKLTEATRT